VTFARPTPAQKEAGLKWKTTQIIFNSQVTLTHIPLGAYDYVVNGKPVIEWITERYQVTRDKDSGIVNDPNDWCKEHDQPRVHRGPHRPSSAGERGNYQDRKPTTRSERTRQR
jgi:hypothetical protein